jgi:glutamate 5-kinase
MEKKVLVVKLGTAVITNSKGKIDLRIIKKVAAEMAVLHSKYRLVLVSSGAVGSGKAYFPNYKGTLTERKAAAAVGNPILMQLYYKSFLKYDMAVAQALCERHHFSNRKQFLQLKETFEEFWRNGILPVVNENDLVSNVELKFSDNDELATLIAVGFSAEALLLCTSVGGFLDDEKRLLPVVPKIDAKILRYVTSEKSSSGLGGMLSKLTSTKLAVSLGIRVVIGGLAGNTPLQTALSGNSGTTFLPKASNLRARQKWLASGSITPGSMYVDAGAVKALGNRKSLLTVGIRKTGGLFVRGEVVQLMDEEGAIIGVAKARLSSKEVNEQLQQKNSTAAHADDIVLF